MKSGYNTEAIFFGFSASLIRVSLLFSRMVFKRKLKKHREEKSMQHLRLNRNMKAKNKNLMTLEEFKEKNYGKRGTKKRDELEAGYESFKIGAMILQTRIEMGMTQEQLAEKVGTTKSYISKIENDIKEARLSTLQKIIEIGFGGKLELNIRLR